MVLESLKTSQDRGTDWTGHQPCHAAARVHQAQVRGGDSLHLSEGERRRRERVVQRAAQILQAWVRHHPRHAACVACVVCARVCVVMLRGEGYDGAREYAATFNELQEATVTVACHYTCTALHCEQY